MSKITFDFACQDDCLDKMVPSDLRRLVSERDYLRQQLDSHIDFVKQYQADNKALTAELAEMTINWQACCDQICDLEAQVERLQKTRDECERQYQEAMDKYIAADAQVERLEAKCERLLFEAQFHHGEDSAHKSSLFEIYQALGIQKGDWNGARPAIEKFNAANAQVRKLQVALGDIVNVYNCGDGNTIARFMDDMIERGEAVLAETASDGEGVN